MATRRSVHPKLFTDLPHFFRRLSSSVPPFTSAAQQAYFALEFDSLNFSERRTTTQFYSIVNLNDTKKLFASVPTKKLIKSTATLALCSKSYMVTLGTHVMNSKLMENRISKGIVLGVIKHTFYDHFCGGENLKEADLTVKRLAKSGLKAMLDYGLEHAVDEASCDSNLEEFLRTIESAKTATSDSPISYIVVKITAICPPSLLERVSDLLRWEYKTKSLNLPWKLDCLPIFADSSPFYHTLTEPNPLTFEEERSLEKAYKRLIKICENSLEADIPLLIDAEDTSIQPAIDYFAYTAAIRYRRETGPLVFNTMQAYRIDAEERLEMARKAAEERGMILGIKLVRGAYMSSERRLAESLGAISPIHDTATETHKCFNKCAALMLQAVADGSGSVVMATHNVVSGLDWIGLDCSS
ncbi:proline dehydrogenase 1, mitochondrial-like isoform X2 [Andrographis paniculata]|uniref:proline dehydrogenase 1, mitochondrial-like isoform X2 n=1 Tax=Andrographis paniculata TaxID=175694 RepID=UPI0021E907CA|nr:proline dehydrogenase 1, mitochondrial-like isoform X2 [Andrographis paniculata]